MCRLSVEPARAYTRACALFYWSTYTIFQLENVYIFLTCQERWNLSLDFAWTELEVCACFQLSMCMLSVVWAYARFQLNMCMLYLSMCTPSVKFSLEHAHTFTWTCAHFHLSMWTHFSICMLSLEYAHSFEHMHAFNWACGHFQLSMCTISGPG